MKRPAQLVAPPPVAGGYRPPRPLIDLGATAARHVPQVRLARLSPERKQQFWRGLKRSDPARAEALTHLLREDAFVRELVQTMAAEPCMDQPEFDAIMEAGA